MADDRKPETDDEPTSPEKAAAELAAEIALNPPKPLHGHQTRKWLRDFPQ